MAREKRQPWRAASWRSAGMISGDSLWRNNQWDERNKWVAVEIIFTPNDREQRLFEFTPDEVIAYNEQIPFSPNESVASIKPCDNEEDDEDDCDLDSDSDWEEDWIVRIDGDRAIQYCKKLRDMCAELAERGEDEERTFHVRDVLGPRWVEMDKSLLGGTLQELFEWFGELIKIAPGDYSQFNKMDSSQYGKKEEFSHLHWVDMWRLATRLESSSICHLAAQMLAGATWKAELNEDEDRLTGHWEYTRPTSTGTYPTLNASEARDDVAMNDEVDEEEEPSEEEAEDCYHSEKYEDDDGTREPSTLPSEYDFINYNLIMNVWRATDFAADRDVGYDYRDGQIDWDSKKLLGFLLDCVIYKDIKAYAPGMGTRALGPVLVELLKNGGGIAAELGLRILYASHHVSRDCPWDKISLYIEEIKEYDDEGPFVAWPFLAR